MESASFASKKRKVFDAADDDDDHVDDDEEEKMEKFYALVNTIREARERFININKKSKIDDHEKKDVVVWKPSFQREDFMEVADHHLQLKKMIKPSNPMMSCFATPTTSQNKLEGTNNIDQKEEVINNEKGLDLDLTLSL